MLFENLGNPVFGERIWNIFAYSLIGSVGMLCSFLCMICLFGVVQKITVKRVVLYLVPVAGCPLLGMIGACFFRFTDGFDMGRMILRIVIACLFFLYYFLVNCRISDKPNIFRVLEQIFIFAVLVLYIGVLFFALATYQKNQTLIADIFMTLTIRSDFIKMHIEFAFLIPLILIAIIVYVFLYRKQRFYQFGAGNVIVLMVWSLAVSIITTSLTPMDESETVTAMQYVFATFLIILSVILPVSICLISYRSILVEKNRVQESYLENELAYIEQYKMSQEKTREFRHDVINNLSVLLYLIKEGKKTEAGAYLDEMVGQVQNLSSKYVTGDEMLDCIVAMKAEKMEKAGIRFSLEGATEGGLHMKPMEICTIFSNLLDNAIEAQERILDLQKEKWVEMSIKKSDQFYLFRIRNTTDGLVSIGELNMMEGYTSKADVKHHGLGLQNIKQAVEDRNGVLKFEASENVFLATVMLPRSE